MSDRPRAGLADVLVLVLTPALIIALINSLVFFLAEVFYAGAYPARLLWILFFFVCGAVLIGRVALTAEIAGRANVYAAVLGGLVWLGLNRYVDYPADSPAAPWRGLINLGLVALVLWCARRLTKDCTDLGDDVEVSGEGLLQAAGLEALDPRPPEANPPEPEDAGPEPRSWIECYYRYRERRRKRRAPGASVVWFSLAALPLFGLGQALVPADAVGRRRYSFLLMTAYLGSGLGLLLATCFLGLRRYLRQRKLEMPARMAVTWLGVGAAVIAGLVLCGAFLPRPAAEVSLLDLGRAVGGKQEASEYAKGGDEAGQDTSRQTGRGEDADKEARNGGEGKKDDREGARGKEGDRPGGEGQDRQGGGQGARDRTQDGRNEPRKNSDSSSATSQANDLMRTVGPVLKWVVFGVIVLVVLAVALRGGLRWLANFSRWARDLLAALRRFWEGLFGGATGADGGTPGAEEKAAAAPRPFASFGDPFADGRAGRMTADELVRLTFAAVQAWAAERGWGRAGGETPMEFAERLGGEAPALADDVRRLAMLYARCVYGVGAVPDGVAQALRGLWRRLEAAAERPLSA